MNLDQRSNKYTYNNKAQCPNYFFGRYLSNSLHSFQPKKSVGHTFILQKTPNAYPFVRENEGVMWGLYLSKDCISPMNLLAEVRD